MAISNRKNILLVGFSLKEALYSMYKKTGTEYAEKDTTKYYFFV